MGNLHLWILSLLVVTCSLFLRHLKQIYTHLNAFPTTPYLPILGHVFDYANPYTTLPSLTQKLRHYGGIIRQFIGPRKPCLLIANRNFLKFLCDNRKYVSKSKFYGYLKPWLGEGLITSDGPKWLSRRKALTASFTQSTVLESFIEVFEEKSDFLIKILSTQNQQKVNLHPLMKRLTLDIICETAMGISLNFQKETALDSLYAKSVEVICEVFQNRLTSFVKNFDFFFWFTTDCNRQKEALTVVDDMFETIIEKKLEDKRRKPYEPENRPDMLDLMMEVSIDGKKLSKGELREEINTFMFAGYDTTSTAMSLTLYEIAGHPDVQMKLYEEQKQIFGDNLSTVGISKQKLQEMHFLDMVIQEALRLHTIVPYIGKRVTKDLLYENKLIPAMLNINVLIYAFHHNPDYYQDPETFNPDRFDKENKIDEYTYIPFGVKPRQCLGKNFALLEMKCVLSKIIRNFEVQKVPDCPLKIEPKLVLFSSSGIWVQLRKRVSTNNK